MSDAERTVLAGEAPQVSGPHGPGEQFSRLLRSSLLPTLIVGGAVVLGCALLGAREAWSAALGAALVILFFSLSLLVMARTAHLEPVLVMAIVLGVYTVKIVGLGVAMVVLRDATWLSGTALALTVITCTLVWLAAQMRAFTRLRLPVSVAPDGPASSPEGQS
jgi:hypothetical protein